MFLTLLSLSIQSEKRCYDKVCIGATTWDAGQLSTNAITFTPFGSLFRHYLVGGVDCDLELFTCKRHANGTPWCDYATPGPSTDPWDYKICKADDYCDYTDIFRFPICSTSSGSTAKNTLYIIIVPCIIGGLVFFVVIAFLKQREERELEIRRYEVPMQVRRYRCNKKSLVSLPSLVMCSTAAAPITAAGSKDIKQIPTAAAVRASTNPLACASYPLSAAATARNNAFKIIVV